MLLAVFIFCILILLASAVAIVSNIKSDQRQQVLTDLGLGYSWTAPLKSPFYKWEWRKTSDDRVWGERIVREAFEKQKIALTAEDLEFFSRTCAQYASGSSVDKRAVITRIEKILNQSVAASSVASRFIAPLLEKTLSMTPAQAKKLLDQAHIQSSIQNASERLAVYLFNKMLNSHGLSIIGNPAGLQVNQEDGSVLMTLKGFDSWDFWLQSCRESIDQILSDRSRFNNPPQAKFLRGKMVDTYIQNHVNHLKGSRKFTKDLTQICSQESLNKSRTEIDSLERTFYTWLFTESIRFSIKGHATIRNLLTIPELPSRLRDALLTFITPVYESLPAILQRFPRHIFFYGANSNTRAYAVQQYLVHTSKINQVLSEVVNIKFRAPLLLRLLESDVSKARTPASATALLPSEIHKYGNSDTSAAESVNRGQLPLMLDGQKRMVMFEKNLEKSTAEKMGWIIEFPAADFTPKEHAQLDRGEYLIYKRINCDQFGDFETDQDSRSGQARREQFLNAMFDKILQDTASMVTPLDDLEFNSEEAEEE